MKKLIKNIVWMPLLVLGLSSCTDWLDVKPKTSIVLEDMWQDQSDVEAVVLSCYNGMLQNDFMQRVMTWGELRSDNLIHNDAPSTDAGKGVKEMYKSASLSSVLETDGITSWAPMYNVIKLCNFVIRYAPDVCKVDPDYLQSEMEAHLAEAYTIRALCYFYLIRTFKEVPYITEPTLDDQQELQIAATPGDEILPLLIQDLEIYAKEKAQSQYASSSSNSSMKVTRCRITRNAVCALLADMYLWKASANENVTSAEHDYQQVIDNCDRIFKDTISSLSTTVVGNSALYLLPQYTSNFSGAGNMETIFGLAADKEALWQQDKNNLVFVNQVYGSDNIDGGMRGDWATTYKTTVNDKYQKPTTYTDISFPYLADVNDNAALLKSDSRFLYNGSMSGVGFIVYKYTEEGGFGNYPNWIFYRLADIYLMKAEALIEQMNCSFTLDEKGDPIFTNQTDKPEEYAEQMKKAHILIGRVYRRSNNLNTTCPAYKDYSATEADLVYAERRREFMFEGKRWFDLVRMARRDNKRNPAKATVALINSVKTKMTEGADLIGSRLSSMDALYWPINKSELQRNSKLQQNPYYVSKSSDIEKDY